MTEYLTPEQILRLIAKVPPDERVMALSAIIEGLPQSIVEGLLDLLQKELAARVAAREIRESQSKSL